MVFGCAFVKSNVDSLLFRMSNCNIIIYDLFRDLADFGMGMNVPPPVMSREEFEARKADMRRKRENERRAERYVELLLMAGFHILIYIVKKFDSPLFVNY